MSNAETVILESSSANGSHTESATPPHRLSLLDRMDPSIGEASVGIGALLTELVRRSLRGGVSNIDHHLAEFSEEQVQAALERQLPLVRDVATEIADATSREITQLAVAELTEQTAAKTKEMMVALEATDGRLQQAVTEVDQRLHQSLDETGQKFAGELSLTAIKAQEATAAIASTVGQLEQQTRQTTTQLAETITANQKATGNQLQSFEQELRESAKRSWQKINVKIDELRGQTEAIPQVADRVTQVETVHRQLSQQLSAQQSALQQHVASLEQQLRSALEKCSSLSSRLEELERPRGISGWIQRLRGGSKKLPAPEDESEQAE